MTVQLVTQTLFPTSTTSIKTDIRIAAGANYITTVNQRLCEKQIIGETHKENKPKLFKSRENYKRQDY